MINYIQWNKDKNEDVSSKLYKAEVGMHAITLKSLKLMTYNSVIW